MQSVFKTYLVTSFIDLDFTCTASFSNLKYKNLPTCLFWLQVIVSPTCPVCPPHVMTSFMNSPLQRPWKRLGQTDASHWHENSINIRKRSTKAPKSVNQETFEMTWLHRRLSSTLNARVCPVLGWWSVCGVLCAKSGPNEFCNRIFLPERST